MPKKWHLFECLCLANLNRAIVIGYVLLNMTWAQVEIEAKHIKNRSAGYKWLYNRMNHRFQNIDNVLNIIKIILGPITGIMAFTFPAGERIWLNTLYSILAVASGATAAFALWFDAREKGHIYSKYVNPFTTFESEITQQLARPISRRDSSQEFHGWIQKRYNELLSFNMPIHADIVATFVRTHTEYDRMDMPDIVHALYDMPPEQQIPRLRSTPIIDARGHPVETPQGMLDGESLGVVVVDINNSAPSAPTTPTTASSESVITYDMRYNDAVMQYELQRMHAAVR